MHIQKNKDFKLGSHYKLYCKIYPFRDSNGNNLKSVDASMRAGYIEIRVSKSFPDGVPKCPTMHLLNFDPAPADHAHLIAESVSKSQEIFVKLQSEIERYNKENNFIEWVCNDCGYMELNDTKPEPKKWPDLHVCVFRENLLNRKEKL